jgi:hypothetical protein
MSAPLQTKEAAYQAYINCNQNLTETVRELKKRGYVISRQTLSDWKQKYDWDGRAARTDIEQNRVDNALSDYSLIKPLLDQLPRYEEYFATLPVGQLDNQAVYARNHIIKTIFSIKESVEKRKGNIDESINPANQKIIKTPQDALKALEEVLQTKLNKLLSNPGMVTKADIKACDDIQGIIEKYKTKYAPDKKQGKKVLSADEINNITEQLKL